MKNLLLPGLICWLLVAFLLPSCVRDVVMDAHEKPQVVVVCILSDEAEQTLQLYFTKGASLAEAPALTEASVALLDDDGLVGHFRRKQGGEWTLAYKAIPKKHYRLEIEVPGYDLITAEQTMPDVPKIFAYGMFPHSVELYYQGLHFPTTDTRPFVPNAEEFESLPLGLKCYYLLDITDPMWIFAMNYDPETGRHVIAEEICTECPFVDTYNIMDKYYVAPERTDIPNPYVKGSHISKLAPHLEGMSLHDKFLHFLPRNLSSSKGWWFMIAGNMRGKYNCKDFYQYYYNDIGLANPLLPDEGYVEAQTVSADIEEYLFDAREKFLLQESSDLSTIYLRDNSFTNITGGVGLFGATVIRRYQWSGEYEYVDDGVEAYYSGAGIDDKNCYLSEESREKVIQAIYDNR